MMLAIMGIAWGQVPVNPKRMRHKHSDALVSFAGPATNLVLGLIFCLAAAALIIFSGIQDSANAQISSNALRLFYRGAMLNFVLFIFNMLPAPGFDGWHILSSFFPRLKTSDAQGMYFVGLVILILGFTYIKYLFLICERISIYVILGMAYLAKMLGA